MFAACLKLSPTTHPKLSGSAIKECARSALRVGLVLLLFYVPGLSQEAVLAVPDGTLIRAKVKGKCSSKKVKVGDAVALISVEDIRGPGNNIVIPKGATLTGHVAAVQKYKENEAWARLSLVVDYAEVQNQRVSLSARLDSIELLKSEISSRYEPRANPASPGRSGQPAPVGLGPRPPLPGETPVPVGPTTPPRREEPLKSLSEMGRFAPILGYRLLHVTHVWSGVPGSPNRTLTLVSRVADIELTEKDAILAFRRVQD